MNARTRHITITSYVPMLYDATNLIRHQVKTSRRVIVVVVVVVVSLVTAQIRSTVFPADMRHE